MNTFPGLKEKESKSALVHGLRRPVKGIKIQGRITDNTDRIQSKKQPVNIQNVFTKRERGYNLRRTFYFKITRVLTTRKTKKQVSDYIGPIKNLQYKHFSGSSNLLFYLFYSIVEYAYV